MKKYLLLLSTLLMVHTVCLGQKPFKAKLFGYHIDPDSTGKGIKKVYHGHDVTSFVHKSNGKLLITIPGTGGNAGAFLDFNTYAAVMGYHTLSLDYPNKRNTATLSNSPDKLVFDKFRQELAFGTPVSDSINIDTANSIVNRITCLVNYLAKTRPAEDWDQFLKNGNIIWKKVVLAGHSQGAGHAAYLGTKFKVHRVIMLSGPQDFLTKYDIPAPWLSAQSATPAKDYYSLLHVNDAYNTSRQTRNDLTIMHADSTVVEHFYNLAGYKGKAHVLISDVKLTPENMQYDNWRTAPPIKPEQEPSANHNASIRPLNKDAWRYLLK